MSVGVKGLTKVKGTQAINNLTLRVNKSFTSLSLTTLKQYHNLGLPST